MPRYELVDGKSNKFWEITLEGSSFTTTYGRIGTTGQTTLKKYDSPDKAQRAHDKLIASKVKKGYRAVDAPEAAPPPGARDPEQEAGIAAEPDDLARKLVYADWLQQNGNPWGELIEVQHALQSKPKAKRLASREAELLAQLGLPPVEFASFEWSCGLIKALHLFNELDWMEKDSVDPRALAEQVFKLPMCVALQELRFGIMRWDYNYLDVPLMLQVASQQPWARRLARLFLGDIAPTIDMSHHAVGDVALISKAFPALEWLKIYSGETYEGEKTLGLGTFDLPRLTTLIIATCSLSKKRLKAVTRGKLPALERLELWFGTAEYGANSDVGDLKPLLEGSRLPKLAHLGLKNAEFEGAIAAVLPSSALAGRLLSLDLSMGTMTDEEISPLAAGARAFSRLTRLDVSDNFLTQGGLDELVEAFPGVEIVSAEQKPLEDGDWRYVSVGE